MSEEKLLVVDKLRTEFFQSKKSSVTAINEISFYINKGEIVGLVGESGPFDYASFKLYVRKSYKRRSSL